MVVAARAHGLQAIDAVYIDYKDEAGLVVQAEEGARWGFTGKQVLCRSPPRCTLGVGQPVNSAKI